jgi:hypothetical protein
MAASMLTASAVYAADVRPQAIEAHIRFLADDVLEGRETGTRGFDIAANYVASQFAQMGLVPAGDSGSWFQPIPFRGAQLVPEKSSFILRQGGKATKLVHRKDALLWADFSSADNRLTAPIVFAGFGIVAPELGHDDYASLDARGKVVLLLTGAPPAFPSEQRAYYSSGEHKQAAAVAHGAVGMLSLKSITDEKRYPFAKAAKQTGMTPMRYVGPDGKPADVEPQIRAGASLSREAAAKLFAGAPMTVDRVLEDAEKGVAHSFPLDASASAHIVTRYRELRSRNVAGMLRGSDPARRDEYVVYTAHLDHLGANGTGADKIYNGALDNGSGIAALLEIARAFAALPQPPARSVLFVAVTGEEKGEQGSEYIAAFPTVPRDAIVADINMDMFQMHYPVADLVALGGEHTNLGELAKSAAETVGFTMTPDPQPEEVRFIRSDQFSFVKKGIPAIHLKAGPHSSDASIDGVQVSREWLRNIYHTPKDDLSQHIDYASGARYAQTNFLLGLAVANAAARPAWKAGDFFGEKFVAGKP